MPKKNNGGTLLGEGTYGCVFDPAPPCSDQEQSISPVHPRSAHSTVAKVFADGEDAYDEWEKAEVISRIDPEQKYFMYALTRCHTTGKMILVDPAASKCSKVTSDAQTMYPMVKMPKGDQTIEQFVSSTKPMTLDRLLLCMKDVFDGIRLLSSHNIVHQDLKFDNILVDTKSNRAKIIDMGLIQDARTLFDPTANPYLHSEYWLHPPEYRICVHMMRHGHRSLTKEVARSLLTTDLKILNIRFNKKNRHTLAQLVSNVMFNYCDYDYEFVTFATSLAKYNTAYEAIEALAKYAKRVDVYSAGITMAYLLQYMSPSLLFTYPSLQELVQNCITPNPRKRYTAQKASAHITSILQSLSMPK